MTQQAITGLVIEDDGKIVSKGFATEDAEEALEWSTRELLPDGTMLQSIYLGEVVCKRWFAKES